MSIIHESVAGVLQQIGVGKKAKATQPANNTKFLNEGVQRGAPKAKAAAVVTEADKKDTKAKGDETDGGNPEGDTVIANAKPTQVEASNKPTEVEVKLDEAESFWLTKLNKSELVAIVFSESEGKVEAEAFGINEEDLAPFGGKLPSVPANWAKAAKGKERKAGAAAAIVLAKIESMNSQGREVLAGHVASACGWKHPMEGTGKKVTVGGESK